MFLQKNLSPTVESPTTAQPLEFDDDANEVVGSPETRHKTLESNSASAESNPPAKPPRPKSPSSQAEATLIEAFPGLDAKVVKAVLVASGGKLEPAFNALLSQYDVIAYRIPFKPAVTGMSDPSFQAEPIAQAKARPQQGQSQLESDELYARQLAAHYQQASDRGEQGSRLQGSQQPAARARNNGMSYNELHDDKDYSFFDGNSTREMLQ